MSPDILQQLVRREAPLQRFEDLLECKDGLLRVFYVWTGMYQVSRTSGSSVATQVPSAMTVAVHWLFAGAQGVGKTTIAKMACSEVTKARLKHWAAEEGG